MLKYYFIFLLAFAVTALAKGDDNRERRVRVAMALQDTTVAPITEAPAPSIKKWPSYSEGYEQALKESKVLVTYIGCEGSHPVEAVTGAVVSVQKCLANYSKGTIIVAYPFGNELVLHKTLRCEDFAVVAKEVTIAVKKKANITTADKAIEKPLDWSMISTKDDCCSTCKDCVCSDKEYCKTNRCVVATPAVTVTEPTTPAVTQPTLYLVRDKNGNYYYSYCKDGRCSNPR